jgi:GTP-binding protein
VDEVSKDDQQKLLDILTDNFAQLWWAPVIFTSAKNDIGLDKALQFASKVASTANKEIPQEELDLFLEHIIKNQMPGKMEDQRAPKLYNMKQVSVRPPVFRILVNFPNAFAFSWKKLFEKQFRLKFGLEGTPVIITYARKQ